MEKIKELNKTELEQVNGGLDDGIWCMMGGYSTSPDAMFCFTSGKGNGIGACVYIGIGICYTDTED